MLGGGPGNKVGKGEGEVGVGRKEGGERGGRREEGGEREGREESEKKEEGGRQEGSVVYSPLLCCVM